MINGESIKEREGTIPVLNLTPFTVRNCGVVDSVSPQRKCYKYRFSFTSYILNISPSKRKNVEWEEELVFDIGFVKLWIMAIRNVSKSRKKNRFYLGQYAYKLATTKCIVHSEKTLRHFNIYIYIYIPRYMCISVKIYILLHIHNHSEKVFRAILIMFVICKMYWMHNCIMLVWVSFGQYFIIASTTWMRNEYYSLQMQNKHDYDWCWLNDIYILSPSHEQ